MATTQRSITVSRAPSDVDRAPALTVEAIMARMCSAAENASSSLRLTRPFGDQRDDDLPELADALALQVEFNEALVAAVNSIAEFLKRSHDSAKPIADARQTDVVVRLESLAAQINDLNQKFDHADAASSRLDTVCQATAAAQQAAARADDLQALLAANQAAVEQLRQELAAADRSSKEQTAQTDFRLLRLERDRRKGAAASPAKLDSSIDSPGLQQNITAPDVPFDYLLFEHRFRGPTHEIKQRQEAYLDYFLPAESVLDLGCGRGEFVELLTERGAAVIGVDRNEDMVDFCKARGLPIVRGDLFEYLAAQSDGSVGGIFMAQVVEHLPADCVWKLIQLAAQKLKTDGVLLMETINPQCFAAMSCFYLDPSHVRPYHPALLAFMCQQAGLRLECVQFSAPLGGTNAGRFLKSSHDIPPADAMHYQDYAVIARRLSQPL